MLRMRHRLSAHHRDACPRIERGHIDASLHGGDGRLVLGIQVARIGRQQVDGEAVPFDADRAEISDAPRGQCRQRRLTLGAGQQHGVAQMRTAARVPQDTGGQNALIDLESFLLLQLPAGFVRKLGAGGHQTGDGLSGPQHQVFDADKTAEPAGDGGIDRFHVPL